MPGIRRYVLGPDQDGRSAVLAAGPANVQAEEGFYRRATLWATRELPVDDSVGGDRSLSEGVGARREPPPGGMLVRALELWPDTDPDEHPEQFARPNAEVHQRHLPSAADARRHPTMHRTDTLDTITVARGEIYLITDTREALMTPGDTAIIRGVNHGGGNRSDSPRLLVGAMIDARPGT
ncbi:hypothetical protein [Streptomyces tremellae]|uniref:Cupin 2 conserved barrel domain-containing protein n=1 Tax=Streptomyces tremellae TaxID=1124239 RepID=A0ABP7FYU3_9ACTN